jgi:uncharacterized protein YehS (DUF1456 family)
MSTLKHDHFKAITISVTYFSRSTQLPLTSQLSLHVRLAQRDLAPLEGFTPWHPRAKSHRDETQANKGIPVINNDILRRIRFTFDLNDDKMMAICKLGGLAATREQISDWLKRDEDPAFQVCKDVDMAIFLNGFIAKNRGTKDSIVPQPELRLTNNIIFRKLKIALNMKDVDVLAVLTQAGFPISKHELSAFFRSPTHKHYRACKDQLLRNFLKGLQLNKVDDKVGSQDTNLR